MQRRNWRPTLLARCKHRGTRHLSKTTCKLLQRGRYAVHAANEPSSPVDYRMAQGAVHCAKQSFFACFLFFPAPFSKMRTKNSVHLQTITLTIALLHVHFICNVAERCTEACWPPAHRRKPDQGWGSIVLFK